MGGISMTDREIKEMPSLLTVKEVAQVLRIGRNAAYELIYRDNFPVLRLGPKKIRVPKNELIRWIETNTGEEEI